MITMRIRETQLKTIMNALKNDIRKVDIHSNDAIDLMDEAIDLIPLGWEARYELEEQGNDDCDNT